MVLRGLVGFGRSDCVCYRFVWVTVKKYMLSNMHNNHSLFHYILNNLQFVQINLPIYMSMRESVCHLLTGLSKVPSATSSETVSSLFA